MTLAAERLAALGLSLPELPTPLATYVPFRRHGGVIYLSGQGPKKPDGTYHQGLVGADVSVEDAYGHARLTGLQLLAAAKAVAGTLDRIEILKVFGMVHALPDFSDHPKVINGCSDLFVAVLGDDGRHARSAVGMASLPNRMTVEIECVIALKD